MQKSISLTTDINDKFRQLNGLRTELNSKITSEVTRINSITRSIADLNQKINTARSVGDNPNDLLDKRDMLVEELASMVDISTNLKDKDEFMVYVGGEILLQGSKVNLLKTEENPDNESFTSIKWKSTNEDIVLNSGSLHANIIARDDDTQRSN